MIGWIVGIIVVFIIILFVILIGYLIYKTRQNDQANYLAYLREQEYLRKQNEQLIQQRLAQQQYQEQQALLAQQAQQNQPVQQIQPDNQEPSYGDSVPTSDALKQNLEDIKTDIEKSVQDGILAPPKEPVEGNQDAAYLYMKNKAKEAQEPSCTTGDITCKPGYYPGNLMLYDQFGEDPEFIWDQICVKETAKLFKNPSKNPDYANRDIQACGMDPFNPKCQEHISCEGDNTSIDQLNKYCGKDDDVYFKPFDCKAYEMMNKPARYIDYIKSLYGTF